MTTNEIKELRNEFKSDLIDLHEKTNTISNQISSLDGRLQGVLPNLATKDDITEKVTSHIDRHVKQFHDLKKTPKSLIPPPINKPDTKITLALIGIITTLVTSLSFLVKHVVEYLAK